VCERRGREGGREKETERDSKMLYTTEICLKEKKRRKDT
jgi:hypothetical protein